MWQIQALYQRGLLPIMVSFKAAISKLFGTREQCSYEKLVPDDLRWS